ncbi:integrase catalytic domain-containing protein [Nephila pilipes]|uniref:Integrase catalytic domain-containing protein n=1 Tax=Nephila pilipes TaxID=299642 RepID=A0A8X6NWP9_NEPPI|nr:integrase catalytic domain-containing protein [Nephila pilipes]
MEGKGLALTFDFKESPSNCKISLLVGVDCYWDLMKGFQRLNLSLVTIETISGWSLQGRCDELTDTREYNKGCHGGVSATLAKIRSRYWIAKGRQIVEKVLKDCLICRKFYLKPAQQITAQLPKKQSSSKSPFYGDRNWSGYSSFWERQSTKIVALFTCAVSR